MTTPLTEEELKEKIWERYGSFELSHDKNVGVVENILEFLLKQRKAYAEFHVEAALKAAIDVDFDNVGYQDEANDYEEARGMAIINAYPLDKIK